jgi:hypothetical protein
VNNGPVTPTQGEGVSVLLVLCAIDAAIQVVALLAPDPSRGAGLLAFAFLPAILAYHAVLWMAIAAGLPLAIACLWRASGVRMLVGLALAVLTVANAVPLIEGVERSRAAADQEAIRNAALDAEVARCASVLAQRVGEASAYFSVPRKVVGIGGPYAVAFENGMQVRFPPVDPPHPPQAFHEFFYDHLMGSTVRVVLRPPTAEQLGDLCRMAGVASTVRLPVLDGDVVLQDRKIDAAAYTDREFPRPQAQGDDVPNRRISRWFHAHTGDRTYAAPGVNPGAGYAVEGPPFTVLTSPVADSVDLYLCNAPLQRPSSPEHFLSTDPACEGQEKVMLLGHIRSSRDGQAPRALLRCVLTVQSALRTGPRHLATPEVIECRGHAIEMVLGYVAG